MTPDSPSADQNPRPPLSSDSDLSRLIDYALLSPRFSDEQIVQGCELAKRRGVRSLTVRAMDAPLASRLLGSSGVQLGAVVSYPHGAATTAVKLYETRDALQRGANIVETVLNVGKMVSRQFRYVETELLQMAQECHRNAAKLVVDLELPWLSPDLRVIACRVAKRSEVDVVRASSVFGPPGCTIEDLQFLVEKCGQIVQVDAGHSVRKWEDAVAAYDAGCSGFQSTNPAIILDEWHAELARRVAEQQANQQQPAE